MARRPARCRKKASGLRQQTVPSARADPPVKTQNQQGLRDDLHPGANSPRQTVPPTKAEVAMAKGAQAVKLHGPSSSSQVLYFTA